MGKWFPGVSAGIEDAGFKDDVSRLLQAELGKTFDKVGTFTVGGYYGAGSKLLWTGSDNKVHRGGFEGSSASPDIDLNLGGLNKPSVLADVATGRNCYGALAVGLEATPPRPSA